VAPAARAPQYGFEAKTLGYLDRWRNAKTHHALAAISLAGYVLPWLMTGPFRIWS
jgi:hypothetical protein